VSIATLAILDTKEAIANKSTNIIADSASSVKYPSVKAIKDYVDSRTSSANNANLAAKASALETPRTINGVPFDGTANITIPVGVTPPDANATTKGLVQLAGDLTGTATAPAIAVNSVTTAKIIDGAVTTGKLAAGAVNTAQVADGAITNAKITSVAGSKVTGDIAGNAATATLATTATSANTATKLTTARTINGTAFDGTADITITTNASTLSGTIGLVNGGTGASTAAGARTNLGLVIGTDVLAQRTFGTAANSAATDFVAATEKGANNGVATLGNNGKIPSTQIPAISFQNVNVVNSDAAMIGIAGAQVGSIAIRTDNNNNYVLSALPASTLSNWIALATPLYVSTVNGYAGPNVVLTTNDVAEGTANKYFTDARVRNAISATAPLNFNTTSGVLSMTAASGSSDGYLSSADFTRFNNKQTALTAGVDYATPSGNITGNAANITGIVSIANGGTGTSTATGALVALGAEPSANKSNDVDGDGSSITKFPTVKSIKDYVDRQSANAGVADNSITSAKINGTIAIAKGGTGASTAAGARTNLGLVIGTDVMAANATTALTGDVSGSGNGSFATTVNSVGGVSSSTIATLPTNVAANTTSITANTNSIAMNATAITTEATTARAAELTLTNSVNANTASITANANSIATLNTNVAANTTSITANTNSIATLNTNVSANTASITANTNAIAANTASITANSNDLALKAPLASPAFTGTPTAPTPVTSDNSTKVATTEYVKASITAANAGLSAIGAISATSNARGATISGTTELILTPADATNGGVVTTGAQTFAGAKTFSNTSNFLTDITVNGIKIGKGGGNNLSNTAVGSGALALNTTGSGSTAFGNNALSKSTGGNATAFGSSALENLTTGTANVAFGYTALNQTSTQNSNTAVGDQAMRMSTGANNTVLGASALSGIAGQTTGDNNTAIGTYALRYATTAAFNVGVGSNSLNNIKTGNDNTVLGYLSGYYAGAGTGTTLTNMSQGVLLGSKVRTGTNTSTNEIAIGYNVVGNGSNTVTIGNYSNTANYFRGDINLTGNVNGGTWSGTTIGNNYGGAGTVNGIMKADGAGVVSAAVAGTDYLSPSGSAALLTNFPTLNQSTTGNAATATKLAATKNINGIAFDGSADITIAADANTLTGTTLASNVTASSLTSVGTITSGVWSATTIDIAKGGTGATTAAGALTNLGAEATANKSTATDLGGANTSDILFPTQKAVKTYVDVQTASAGVSDGSITNAKLAGSITSSKLVGTDITTVGTITSGTWSASVIDIAHGGTGSSTVTGAKTNLGLNNVENTALSTWTGSTNITTVGALTAQTKTFMFQDLILGYGANNQAKIQTDASTKYLSFYPNYNVESTRMWPSGNVTIQTGGTFTDNGYKLEVAGTSKFTGNASIVGNLDVTGNITSATWSGTTIPLTKGGTGATTAADARTNLGLVIGTDVMAANYTTTLTGDVTGAGNGSFATTLAASGVTSGTYGSSTAIPTFTVDSKGRITAASTVGITAGVSTLAYSTTGASNGGTISGTTLTLTAADASNPGLISTGAQTIAGAKTFSSDVTATNFLGNATTATTASNISATSNTSLTSLANLATVGTITSGTWSATEVAIAKGGTGATTASGARTNLGLGSIATKSTIADADVDASAAIAFSKLNITKANITGLGIQDGLTAGSGISLSSGTISVTGLTTSNLASNAAITNAQLANSSTTLGSTTMTLGGTVTSVTGLESVTSTGFTGALTGNASTATKLAATKTINGVAFDGSANITIAADANTLTGTTLASNVVTSSLTSVGTITSGVWSGTAIANNKLANSTTNLGTTTMTLGGTVTSVTGLTSLTATTVVGSLSGTATTATNIAGGLIGSIPYQTAAGTTALLAGNTTSTVKYLASSGNGTNSTAPTWVTPSFVPYTGATSAVDLGDYDLTVNSLTVGRGKTSVSTNSAFGVSALKANTSGANNSAFGSSTLYSNTSGIENTAIGSSALRSNTSGSDNTAVGFSSSYSNISGSNNATFGSYSYYNGKGNRNSAFGHYSLVSPNGETNTGSDNAGFGYQTGFSLTTGNKNIFLGNTAGFNISTSSNNIMLGWNAGSNYGSGSGTNTTGLNSVLIGYDVRPSGDGETNEIVIAGYTGSGNGMVGNGSNTTTIGNSSTTNAIIYGSTSLSNLPSNAASESNGGNFNLTAQNGNGTNKNGGNINLTPGTKTGTGTAGKVIVNGGDMTVNGLTVGRGGNGVSVTNANTSFGISALSSSSTSGSGANTAIGNNVLTSNTSGSKNTGLGFFALNSNVTGTDNTAVGYYALTANNSSSSDNTAIGSNAMFSNTSGIENTAVGFKSLYKNSTGRQNSILGTLAYFNGEGSYNTAVGYRALMSPSASGNTGEFNVSMGYYSGSSMTTGSKNVYLGSNAGYSTTSVSNNILIGYAAGQYYGTSTNAYTSGGGNVLIGNDVRPLADGQTNQVVIAGYTGTGVGMTGNGSNTVTIGNSSNKANYLTGVTNLAAGTMTNTTGVDLTGSINDFFQFNVKNTSTGSQAQSGYAATADNGTNTTGFAWMGINNSTFNYPTAYNIGVANDVTYIGSGQDMHIANANNTKSIIFSTGISTTPYFSEKMRITAIGNVGIGTNSPTALLEVNGTTKINGAATFSSTVAITTGAAAGKVLTSDASGNATWQNSGGSIATMSATGTATSTATYIIFTGSTASQTITVPSAVTLGAGREITIKNVASVTVSIASAGGYLIQDNSTLTATGAALGIEPSNNWMKLVSDGTNWYIMRALF
jgi:hypothetical protein